MFNKDFYPTPKTLALRMFNKVDFTRVQSILEPSAGKGDLIDSLGDFRYHYDARRNQEIFAIEIELELQAVLKDKDINVIDSDFLQHQSTMYFDLVMANFPFSDGERHLTKALDMLYSGQIVCLLNAQTIKNPFSNERKALVKRLSDLDADIEYIEDAFRDAERKTGVEVALIYVSIKHDIEMDLCTGMSEERSKEMPNIEEQNELATRNHYANLVSDFNRTFELVNQQMLDFYKNYKHVSKYLSLNVVREDDNYLDDLNKKLKRQHNRFVKAIKGDFWEKVTDLPEIKKYLPSKQRKLMASNSETFLCKEFTQANIHQFAMNLIADFPKHIDDAIVDVFEELTRYALKDTRWHGDEYATSIHYFNAWKTNSGYKINKKVIFPAMRSSWDVSHSRLGGCSQGLLEDIELIMSYFKPKQGDWSGIVEICNRMLLMGQNRKIETEYLYVSVFKKGTIHLEFKDLDLLRRFNIEACKRKAFLPMDYAEQAYQDLSTEQQGVVNAFEEKQDYKPIKSKLAISDMPALITLQAAA